MSSASDNASKESPTLLPEYSSPSVTAVSEQEECEAYVAPAGGERAGSSAALRSATLVQSKSVAFADDSSSADSVRHANGYWEQLNRIKPKSCLKRRVTYYTNFAPLQALQPRIVEDLSPQQRLDTASYKVENTMSKLLHCGFDCCIVDEQPYAADRKKKIVI